MDEDDDDRSSDPFGGDEPEGERPMSYLGAAGFSFATTFLFFFLLSIVIAARPAAENDLVSKFGCQVVATLLGLFLILRIYAPDKSIRDFLGLRWTNLGFFPLAALLGAAVQVPANALYDLITRRFPTAEGHDEALYEEISGGTPKRIAIFVILALAGPMLEEVFFRGALFRPLRKGYESLGVVFATSLFFAASHLEWQMMLPIGLVGLSLGVLRSASGSLFPGFVMHGVFNGITLYSLYKHPVSDAGSSGPPMPLWLTIGGSAITLVLLLLVYLLGDRSTVAAEARHKDET